MKNESITPKGRKIFLLDQEENSDRFERLFALTTPQALALSQENALLLDHAIDDKGRVSLERMVEVVKASADLSVAAVLKKEVSKQRDTVSDALSKLYATVLDFWKPNLNFIQQEYFITFINNILLELDKEKDFPWINWIEKGKAETTFQYNLFLASEPAEGSFFLYNVPILLTITIFAPYKEVLELEAGDEIKWAWKADGLKLAEVMTLQPKLENTIDHLTGRPPSGIIVSAHGGRWSNVGRGLAIPRGTAISYFVRDGQILSDVNGIEILTSLSAGRWPTAPVVQHLTAGEETYNYECWFASDWADDCGIFEVGTGRLLMPLNRYTEENPLPLSTIIELFPGQTIFWDACRSVTDVEVYATHPTYQGAYLTNKHRVLIEQ